MQNRAPELKSPGRDDGSLPRHATPWSTTYAADPPFPLTPGQTLTMEWGISKAVTGTLELGVAGYYQQQTTDDRGPGTGSVKDHVVAAGPEVNLIFPKLGLFGSLRYNHEFEAKDRPEGNSVTLTLTKRF